MTNQIQIETMVEFTVPQSGFADDPQGQRIGEHPGLVGDLVIGPRACYGHRSPTRLPDLHARHLTTQPRIPDQPRGEKG